MRAFEEIIKGHINNWNIYQAWLQTPFVPVIGAGLAAGIGTGSWNDLMESLANRFFCFFGEEKLDYEKIKERMSDEWGKVETVIEELRGEDEEFKNNTCRRTECIKNKIKIIEDFVEKNRFGKTYVDMVDVLFRELLGRDAPLSSYEAAELLRIVSDDDELKGNLYEIINEKKEKGKWKIGKDKAIYWLTEAIVTSKKRNERRFIEKDCFTTNFDNIIEAAFMEKSADGLSVGHLHGYFDQEGRPHDICLTLSDLLDNYGSRLDYTENVGEAKQLDLLEQGNSHVIYLFLGTSFSESHIGQLVRFRNNYGIVAVSDKANRNEKAQQIEKARDFGIKRNDVFLYHTDDKGHEPLVTVLHQLARDMEGTMWNNWKFIDNFTQCSRAITKAQNDVLTRVMSWLGDENDVLYIKGGDKLRFNKRDGILIYDQFCLLKEFCKMIREEYIRPDWSTYWNTDEFFEDTAPEPLGNTIFIDIRTEDEEKVKFIKGIRQFYSTHKEWGWKYKIISFEFTPNDKYQISNMEDIFLNEIKKISDNRIQTQKIMKNLLGVWRMILQAIKMDHKIKVIILSKGQKEPYTVEDEIVLYNDINNKVTQAEKSWTLKSENLDEKILMRTRT